MTRGLPKTAFWMLAALCAAIGLAPAPVRAKTVTVDFTAGVNATVRGVYVTKDYWFELSEDWEFAGPSRLDLRFTHSPILVKQLSSLTVAVNGSPVQSIHLDPTNERQGTLAVSIPGRFFKGGMNVLSLIVKMRSDLKDLCDDVHNPALWTLIERESTLDVDYEDRVIEPDLAGFPGDYANPDLLYSKAKERVHAVVIAPPDPSPGELDAIGALATLLGQEIGMGHGEFRVTTRENVDPATLRGRQIILVGRAEYLNRFRGAPWNLPLGPEVNPPDGSGRLVEYASPFNASRRLLVVTGRDDAAMKLVSDHLKTPASLRGLKGPSVAFDKPPTFEAEPDVQSEAAFVVRLQDLKMSDLMARGKFYHSLTFTLPNPFVGKVRDGAFIRLSMSHSELLLPQSSSLLLKVNGEPVKSIRLTRETAPRNTWDVMIPLQYLGTRYLTFEIELFLDIGDPDCYYNHPEMAWLTLHNDTFLYLPVDTTQGETLSNYPYMLLAWNRFDRVAAVLTEPITDGSLSALFNTVGFLAQGLRSPRFVDLLVTTTKRMTVEQRQATNLIVFGPLGAILGDPEWAAILPREATARDAKPGSMDLMNLAGLLSLARSPFNATRRALAVTGRADTEIAYAAPFLYAPGFVEWVRGTFAAVMADKELRVLLPPTQTDNVSRFDPARVRFEEKEGKIVPVLEVPAPTAPPSRHNVAYLVFFLLTPVLVLLVILRLRSLSRSRRGDA